MPSLPPTLPRFPTYEDDNLHAAAVRDITPPFGPLSLPTSGISRLSEESETMYSAGSTYFQSATRASLDEEVDLEDEFDQDRPLQRQEIEPFEPASSGTEEAVEDKRHSKYNVKPPIGSPGQTSAIAASPRSRSGSASMSPSARGSASSPPKTSKDSTPKSSSNPRSKLVKEVQILKRDVSKTPDYGEGASTDHDDTAEEDATDDHEDQVLSERTLRKRTVQQTHPFRFDKHSFSAQKAGRAMTTKKLEKEVKQEVEGTERVKNGRISNSSSTQKKRKASTTQKQGANNKRRSSSVLSRMPSPEADQHDSIFNAAKATLLVRLDGFPGAAAAISLAQCDHIDKLMDFITESWEWKYNGASFSHAIVSFSWLPADSNVLLRAGSETTFERVVAEAQRAPMWAEDGHCDIDVTVYVQ